MSTRKAVKRQHNIVHFQERQCACGCGRIAYGGSYAGYPKSREYNACAARVYRRNRKAELENLRFDVKQSQIDVQQSEKRFSEAVATAVAAAVKTALADLRVPVQAQSEAPTLRTVSAPKADYAEPELEVKRTEGDGGKSSANFMQSLLNIEASAKPRAAIAIPEAKKVVESEERTPGGLKKLQGGDAVLSVPDFDDMEDLF